MRDLVSVYRPRRLDQIIGQPDVTARIKAYLESGSNQTLLFSGPTGTGKTTAARIIGAKRTCENPDPPCGQCQDCAYAFSGLGMFGYTEMDAALHNEVDHAKFIAERLIASSLTSWVTFVDEAHMLDRKSQDTLLKAVENPQSSALFIMATSEPDGLKAQLRTRCLEIPFQRIRDVDCQRLLASVCVKEGISFDHAALEMLSVAANGSARAGLNSLDQAIHEGVVTSEQVAKSLALGDLSPLLDFFHALITRDELAQDEILDAWPQDPLPIARLIRDFLLYLYGFEVAAVRRTSIINPAFFRVTAREREPIVAGFRQLAARRSFEDFWLDILQLWNSDLTTIADRSGLKIKVYRFQRTIYAAVGHENGPSALSQEPKPVQRARSAKKPVKSNASGAREQYLDVAQAEYLYDAASFLPQQYGLLMNTHIRLNFAELGIANETDASRLVSRLTHELSLRVRAWSRHRQAHWLYVNRRSNSGLHTDIGLHLPPEGLDRIEAWLKEKMAYWTSAEAKGWQVDAAKAARSKGWVSNRVQRHWCIFRKLCGGIDPNILEWNSCKVRVPLIDLLKVATGDREPIGELVALRAMGTSRSLGPDRQKRAATGRMSILSAFQDDAWDAIYSGWELNEHRDRADELARRQEEREKIELENPGGTQLEVDVRRMAMAKLEATWPIDPKLRRRSWQGWWA